MTRPSGLPALLLAGLALSACGGPAPPPLRLHADVKQVMAAVIDPAADVVWESVGTIDTVEGTQEIRPRSDEEWARVAQAAWVVTESANASLDTYVMPAVFEWVRRHEPDVSKRIAKILSLAPYVGGCLAGLAAADAYTDPSHLSGWIIGWDAATGTANAYPAWANPGNTMWGLSSYAANWQMFGDQGARLAKIQDGLSNTILFNEKYAVAKRPSGNPINGATLWGYGVDPRTIFRHLEKEGQVVGDEDEPAEDGPP